MNGTVAALCISSAKGEPMQSVQEVLAIAGEGLKGDRYASGEGSFNKGAKGKRQVTFINGLFFGGSGFEYTDSRRNIVVLGVELMYLIGREFTAGDAGFRGVKYCEPCNRPSNLADKEHSFQNTFFDRGGLIAEVIKTGIIKVGGVVIPPPKGY